jgi:uncharacterized protein with HEPN domain
MLEAIAKTQRYTAGLNYESFVDHEMVIDAVIRNIEIIGEAANHAPEEIQHRYPQLPWAEMRGIRHILIHEYFGVSLPILWYTITHDLPSLVPLLQTIVHEEEQGAS